MAEKVGGVYIEIQAKMGNLERDLINLREKLEGVDKKSKQVGNSMAAMGRMIAGAAITGAVVGLGTAALKASAAMEQNRVAFTTMLGSAEKATQLLKEMTAFAAATPFELPQIVEGGKKLLAFGFSASEIIPTLTKLGDVSAALSIPIGELSDIYGKMKVQGVIQAEELNQLAGRGIPVFTELAKVMGTTSDKVKKLGSEGKISFKELEQAFTNMTKEGSQFGGMMNAQSKTLVGQWSNFNDALGKTAVLLGDQMAPTAKALLTLLSSIVNSTNELQESYNEAIKKQVERLNNEGKFTEAYIRQNGFLATGLNLINGIAAKEIELQQIKKDQDIIERTLFNHRHGGTKLTKEQVGYLESMTAEMERQESIIRGTNSGWAKQTAGYKAFEDIITKANNKTKEMEASGIKNAESWKKIREEAKKFSEQLKSDAGETTDPVLKIKREIDALDEAAQKNKDYYLKGTINATQYNNNIINGAIARANLIDQLETLEWETRVAKFQQYSSVLTNFSGQLAQLSQMNASNQTAEVDNRMTREMSAIEERYNREKELIEQSLMTEEEKNAALANLDTERARQEKELQEKAAKEKRKIAHEAAKQQKALAVFDTILATPVAAFQAFKALSGIPVVGPALGAAAAAAATALGMAKLKLIYDQPLPALAQGGIVPAVPGGNQFTIGEAGSAEAVIPLNDQTLGRLASMINGAGGGGGQVLHLNLSIDGDKLYSNIYRASKNGQFMIDSQAVV